MSTSNDEDEDEYPRRKPGRRRDEEDDDDDPRRRPRRRRVDDDHRDIGDDAGMRLLMPVGRSGWAIASGYLGLISVLCVPAPLAVITGLLAIREMRRDPKKHGMGRAVFGLIMGGIGTLVLILLLVALAVSAVNGK